MAITICAVISSADDFMAIADWVKVKREWLSKFLDLLAGTVDFFNDHFEDDFARTNVRRHDTRETGHGREKTWYFRSCPVPADLPDRTRWAGLQAIGVAISNTERDGKDCVEVRYDILSQSVSAQRFAEAVREYWSVENQLDWHST